MIVTHTGNGICLTESELDHKLILSHTLEHHHRYYNVILVYSVSN